MKLIKVEPDVIRGKTINNYGYGETSDKGTYIPGRFVHMAFTNLDLSLDSQKHMAVRNRIAVFEEPSRSIISHIRALINWKISI